MTTDLAGRVALVTGGASGIGAATARALADAGAKVVVTDVNDGAKVASAIDGKFFRHDVTSENEWVAAVAFAKSTFGGLDILVNNAGIFLTKPTRQTTLEEFRRVMQVNVDGVFLGLKHAIPVIAERAEKWDGGGSVVNLSSVSGIVGQANTLEVRAEGARQFRAPGHHRYADDRSVCGCVVRSDWPRLKQHQGEVRREPPDGTPRPRHRYRQCDYVPRRRQGRVHDRV